MASYTKSYNRFGRQAIEDIKNFFANLQKKEQERETYDKVISAFKNAQNRMKGIGGGNDPADYTFSEGKTIPSGMNFKNPLEPDIPLQEPGDIMLGNYVDKFTRDDAGKPVSYSPERFNRSQETIQDFQKELIPLILDPNAPEGTLQRFNVLGELLSGQSQGMQPPKKEGFNLGEGQVRFEQQGNLPAQKIAEGKPKKEKVNQYEMDENTGKHKIYEIGGQKYMNRIEVDQNGNPTGESKLERIPGTDEGKTNINNISSPDYSEDYGTVTSGIVEIQELKNQKPELSIPAGLGEEYIRNKLTELGFPEDKLEEEVKNIIENGANYYNDGKGNLISQDDFNKFKEDQKRKYNKSAIQMLKKYDIKTKRGLLEKGGPVETIRKDLKKGTPMKDAIRRFKQFNPQITEEEIDLLEKYFIIHLL